MMRSLFEMKRVELNELFATAPAGETPCGRTRGTALIATGTPMARAFARVVRAFAWKGKTFAQDGRSLRNRITPLDILAVPARVTTEASREDGAPCIALDYSRTSRLAWFVRDEIREVEPGMFLGKAYAFGIPTIFFALETKT
jgi:hypothetical protein